MTMGTQIPDVAAGTHGRNERISRWDLALNIGAVAGIICMLLAAASMFLGISPLIFRSGSMAPEINTGALALAKTIDASEVRVGDVIAVNDEGGTSITHRVVSASGAGGDAVSVVLKGDANSVEDPSPYVITEAQRVFVHVPMLGFVAAWMSGKAVIFLAGLLSGVLMMLAFGPNRTRNGSINDKETGDALHVS